MEGHQLHNSPPGAVKHFKWLCREVKLNLSLLPPWCFCFRWSRAVFLPQSDRRTWCWRPSHRVMKNQAAAEFKHGGERLEMTKVSDMKLTDNNPMVPWHRAGYFKGRRPCSSPQLTLSFLCFLECSSAGLPEVHQDEGAQWLPWHHVCYGPQSIQFL